MMMNQQQQQDLMMNQYHNSYHYNRQFNNTMYCQEMAVQSYGNPVNKGMLQLNENSQEFIPSFGYMDQNQLYQNTIENNPHNTHGQEGFENYEGGFEFNPNDFKNLSARDYRGSQLNFANNEHELVKSSKKDTEIESLQ